MHTQRRRSWAAAVAVLVGALLVVAAYTVMVEPGADAQSDPTGPTASCAGDGTFAIWPDPGFEVEQDESSHLYYPGILQRTHPLPTPIPAGAYELDAVSYDGYPDRDGAPAQPGEQWYLDFLDADGNLLATSGVTADLADGVVEATWSGSIGGVALSAPAVTLIARHADPDGPSPNSVHPVCLGWTRLPDPTTTSTAATSSTSSTSSTTTAVPTSSTTTVATEVGGVTTVPPTTASPPVRVAGATTVPPARPATAVVVEPRVTG